MSSPVFFDKQWYLAENPDVGLVGMDPWEHYRWLGRMLGRKPAPSGGEPLTIAAVIPLYNGESFIERSLRSVLAQTVEPEEIIVIDDGSVDGGQAIVERIAAGSKVPVQLIRKSNGGQSSARNLGIRVSRTSHVALLDQDDAWKPNHLAALRAPLLTGGKLGVVYGDLDHFDEGGKLIRKNFLSRARHVPHPKKSLEDCLKVDMFILPGASLISRQAFEAVGGFDESLIGFEDDDIFLRIYAAGFALHYLKGVSVTDWHIRKNSTSGGPLMARSRMIYFRKLAASYPDLLKECTLPRFRGQVAREILRAIEANDAARVKIAVRDFREILGFEDPPVARKLSLMALAALHRVGFKERAMAGLRSAVKYAT